MSESTCLTCPSVCLHARSRVRGAAGVGAERCGGSSVLGGGDGCCQVRTPAPSGLGLKLSFVQTPVLPSSRQLESEGGRVCLKGQTLTLDWDPTVSLRVGKLPQHNNQIIIVKCFFFCFVFTVCFI